MSLGSRSGLPCRGVVRVSLRPQPRPAVGLAGAAAWERRGLWRASIEIVLGYASAMVLPSPDRPWEMVALIVTGLVAASAVARATRTWRTAARLAFAVAIGGFWFLGCRHGFIRQPAAGFFASLLLVVVWFLPWQLEDRHRRTFAFGVLGMALLASAQLDLATLGPLDRARSAVDQVGTICRPTAGSRRSSPRAHPSAKGMASRRRCSTGSARGRSISRHTRRPWRGPTRPPLVAAAGLPGLPGIHDRSRRAKRRPLCLRFGSELCPSQVRHADRLARGVVRVTPIDARPCLPLPADHGQRGDGSSIARSPDRCSVPRAIRQRPPRDPATSSRSPWSSRRARWSSPTSMASPPDPVMRLQALVASPSIWTISLTKVGRIGFFQGPPTAP